MKMICDVPDEVIKSVRDGTWLGSGVLEKMVAYGIPLDTVKAKIKEHCEHDADYMDGDIIAEGVIQAVDKLLSQRKSR